jgi:inorganic pyrophosphatase
VATRNEEQTAERLSARLIVEQPAGPGNRYRVDARSGAVILDGVTRDASAAPFERGHLPGTLGEDGRPLRAIVPVEFPTFPGCTVIVHPIGLLRMPDRPAPLVVTVPAADPMLAPFREVDELPDALRQAVLAQAAEVTRSDAAAAETTVRAAIEAYQRARAEAERRQRTVPAWKVSDERPPVIDGREAEPYSFAEQAVPRLPARFQEYIARALLPDERILMFIHRPVTATRRGFALRRTKLREGIFVLTDRQVLFMVDSLPPDSTLVHWGYIARVGAVERVAEIQVRHEGQLVVLDVTFAASRGAETASFEFPSEFAEAVDEAAELLGGFVPSAGSRGVRRRYPREIPADLPSLAEVRAQEQAPAWVRETLSDEHVLAWAAAPADRGQPPRLVVGEQSVVVEGADRGKDGRQRIPIGAVTTLGITLSLTGCRLEVAVGDGEAVHRPTLRFQYPAAPPFLGAFTAIRHLLGLPSEEYGDGPARVAEEPGTGS